MLSIEESGKGCPSFRAPHDRQAQDQAEGAHDRHRSARKVDRTPRPCEAPGVPHNGERLVPATAWYLRFGLPISRSFRVCSPAVRPVRTGGNSRAGGAWHLWLGAILRGLGPFPIVPGVHAESTQGRQGRESSLQALASDRTRPRLGARAWPRPPASELHGCAGTCRSGARGN